MVKHKVLLYLASNSPFYTNLYPSIKRGFEEAGCEVIGGSQLLDASTLLATIEDHKPAFVFEMNRVKSEIENFPDNVAHICWLVDFWGRKHKELQGSDILYVWSHSWLKHFKLEGVEYVDFLPPATDASLYYSIDNIEKVYDFIFMGHISRKWSGGEMERLVGYKNGVLITFKDLLPYLQSFVLSKNNPMHLLQALKNENICLFSPISKILLYDITSRVFRQTRREFYIDLFMKISCDMAIYGPDNWLLYEKYKTLYKGFIEQPREINHVIQTAKIMLHDGNYPHFRTFDAMASGVVVVAPKAVDDLIDPWDVLGFKNERDYLSVDIYDNIIDKYKFRDTELLEEISNIAQKKVLREHLWVHRAKKVLYDVLS